MILAAITTCRRAPDMVERAVKSVIAQTYKDWELVVIDDSPSDYELREDVRKMVEGYAAQDSRIRYVAHDNNYGSQRARNTALKIAENTYEGGGHEFIAYLDDDDEWLPEKLEKQIARFAECGDHTGMVYCNFYYADEDLPKLKYSAHFAGMGTEGKVFSKLIEGNFIAMVTLIRTKFLTEIGGFDETMPALQDWEAWLRLSLRYDVAYINEPLVVVYKDEGSDHIGGSYSRIIKAFEKVEDKYKDYLAEHPYTRWRLNNITLPLYMLNGEYRKFFSSWQEMFCLQPQNKADSISALFTALYTVIRAKMKAMLFIVSPSVFYALKNRKHRQKGDSIN